jgi:hypothetical protein
MLTSSFTSSTWKLRKPAMAIQCPNPSNSFIKVISIHPPRTRIYWSNKRLFKSARSKPSLLEHLCYGILTVWRRIDDSIIFLFSSEPWK